MRPGRTTLATACASTLSELDALKKRQSRSTGVENDNLAEDQIKGPWWELALTLSAIWTKVDGAKDVRRFKAMENFIDHFAVEATAAGVTPLQILCDEKGLLWRLENGEQPIGFDQGAMITRGGPHGLQAYGFGVAGLPYKMKPRTAARRIASLRDRQLGQRAA